jgi:hypothetical protein
MTLPIALAPNEGKCCDAVLRRIEARRAAIRRNVRSPEKLHEPGPIELVCEIGDQRFALEHTVIEPFTGFLQMHAQADWRFDPIVQAVSSSVPPGEVWQLMMRHGALDSLRGDELLQAQQAIAGWILETTPMLAIAPYASYPRPLAWTWLPSVPLEVRVDRWSSAIERSSFQICHLMEHATLEPSRKDRIRRTCAKKFTKLQDWSRRGARTILILEDNDIVSTNELLVFDALEAVRHEFEFWPDEIYMVGTFLDEYWPIWLLWMASTATIPWTISEKAGLFATRKS